VSFGDLAAQYARFHERGGVVDLASRVKLLFTGGDRVRYVNGQVTANIAAAKQPCVLPACVTTAKGKLCGDVFVSIGPDAILIDGDAALSGTLPARMERYIVADDVQMEDATGRCAIVHAVGIDPARLAELSGLTPLPANRFGIPGHDLFPPFREQLPPIWEKLTAVCDVLSEELLEVIRIEQGMPRWGRELTEDTLPPEAGLDRTHIDYTKGCYIGQEVISRIKSVGHVNRRLVGFVSPGGAPIPDGGDVFSPAGELCGTITSSAWSFALERPVALGYLRRSATGSDYLVRPAELPITVCELPFTR
jgi:tRNA-modifying protein YgfZ